MAPTVTIYSRRRCAVGCRSEGANQCGVRRREQHRRTPNHANHKEVAMAERNDTREQSRLEQTIEAERGKLLQANAVLRCLYEVLLYADGE